MKTAIEFSYEYNEVFLDVGRKIAKGEPPLWLLIGLNHFSGSIGADTKGVRLKETVEQMHRAADVLLTWLPAFRHLGFGLRSPDDVETVLAALPRIKGDLERLGRPSNGRKPNVRRAVCAAVVVEAWRLLHGKAEPRSVPLMEACDEYWRACGGEQIGETDDPGNWRRPIEQASATRGHDWIRSVLLLAVQNST